MAVLTYGDLCWVRFGSVGEQLALVARVLSDRFIVYKWRVNSRTWTKRVTIARAEVVSTVVNREAPGVVEALEQLGPQLGVTSPQVRP